MAISRSLEFNRWSISSRLILLVVALAAPMNLIALGIVWRLVSEAGATQRTNLLYTARAIATGVDAELGKYTAFAEALARAPSLLEPDLHAFEAEAARLFPTHSVAWVVVSDLEGVQLLNTARRPGDVLRVRPETALAAQRRAFVTHATGTSDVYFSALTQRWLITIIVPVFKDNKPLRVVSVNVDAGNFLGLLNGQHMPKNWLAAIVDGRGHIVARVPGEAFAGDLASATWLPERTREGVFETVSLEGDPVVVANARSADAAWTIGVAIKKAELQSVAWGAALWAAVLGAVVSAFSILLAIGIAHRITGPLRELRMRTASLLTGSAAFRPFEPGSPEIAELWTALRGAAAERNRSIEERRRGETLLTIATNNAGVGMVLLDKNRLYLTANPAFSKILGLGDVDLIGKGPAIVLPEVYETQISPNLDRAFAGERVTYELTRQGADGAPRYFTVVCEPLRNDDGDVSNVVAIIYEITLPKLAELRIAGSEERMRAVIDTAADAIVVIDSTGVVQSFNPAAERIFGYSAQEAIGNNVSFLMPEPDRGAHDGYIAAYLATGNAKIIGIGRDVSARRKDGSTFPAELSVTEWRNAGQRYFTGILRDITERQRRDEQIQTLLREVNHRSKNLLTVVHGIARQTHMRHPDDFMATFSDRIQALAANQDVLVQHEWKDVALDALVRSQLDPFKDLMGPRFKIEGPELRLSATAAQTIGMAVHELATNAAKYGSLSNAEGWIEIFWTIDGLDGDRRRFDMAWLERGGPHVNSPSVAGFGTFVVRDAVRTSLGGKADLAYKSAGVEWRMSCPLSRVVGVRDAGG